MHITKSCNVVVYCNWVIDQKNICHKISTRMSAITTLAQLAGLKILALVVNNYTGNESSMKRCTGSILHLNSLNWAELMILKSSIKSSAPNSSPTTQILHHKFLWCSSFSGWKCFKTWNVGKSMLKFDETKITTRTCHIKHFYL